MDYAEVIEKFHLMWDSFPGLARLITSKHVVLASNRSAEDSGFTEGCICAKVGAPETHRGCRMAEMFRSGEAQIQRFSPEKIKGWNPVAGYPELCVHWAVGVPEE